jgi:protocatechuate 3,4-dioxygenase beta subunit
MTTKMLRTIAVLTACTIALLAATTAFAQARGATPRPPGTATVSGVVLETDGKTPVAFALVQLRTGALGVQGSSYQTTTAEDGTFVVSAVAAASYFIAASKNTYAPAFYSGPESSAAVEPGTAVPVRDAEVVTGVTLRLNRGGVISGRVLDDNGDPVPGAQIGLQAWPPQQRTRGTIFYMPSPEGMFTTDARGAYRLYGLRPGDYVLSTTTGNLPEGEHVGSVTGPLMKYGQTFFPDSADPQGAAVITVESGAERTGIDLRLRLVRLFTLQGSIAWPADAERDSVSIQLRPRNPALGSGSASVGASNDGRFSVDRVQPGDYWLTATGHLSQPAGAVRIPGQTTLFWAAVPINVTDRDVTALSLALQPAMRVAGRLEVEAGNAATVTDPGQVAVTLTVMPGTGPGIEPLVMTARPDAEGRFVITNLTPGRYKASVRSSVAGTIVTLDSVTVGDRTATANEIDVEAGTNVENVRVKIRITKN